MAKTGKKTVVNSEKNKTEARKGKSTGSGMEGNRKINLWIPVAVVAVIVALVALMVALNGGSGSTSKTSPSTGSTTTQSGTTGTTGTTGSTQQADVSWMTLDTTPTAVADKTGIPAKMLMQVLGIKDTQMGQPFKDIGGQAALTKAQSVVAQFGGGMGSSSSGSTGSAPSGMGGTTTP